MTDLNLLNPYVRRIDERFFKAPHFVKERYLFDHELILVLEGEAIITIDGIPYRVKKNDMVFIPPHVQNSFYADKDFTQFFVHFDPIYTEMSPSKRISYTDPDDLTDWKLEMMQKSIFDKDDLPYVFHPKRIESYKKCYYEIKEAMQKNNSIICKTKMLKLLDLIFKDLNIKTERHSKYNLCDEVREYIDGNFLEVLTLEEIARQFDVNKYTLTRKFKTAYGENVIAYYNKKRLTHAKKLLEQNSLSITQVSKQLNFSDVYTFSRFFKTHTGISPKFYVERIKTQ